MSNKIGVLGAGGFLGSRLIEKVGLSGDDRFVPILRYPRGLARLSRISPVWRRGDASKPDELASAISDCRVVLNLTTGADDRILPDTISLIDACRKAGVRRLIHMSSASVYGQVLTPNLSDDAPPASGIWMDYAKQKGRAEVYLRREMAQGSLEIVVLRPGLIWGPGSVWLGGIAEALRSQSAFLLNGGAGVCNLIHVDNLVDDLKDVALFEENASGFYHSSDDEDLNWRQYYRALAQEIGVEPETIHVIEMANWNEGMGAMLEWVKQHPLAKSVKSRISKEFKLGVKRRLRECLDLLNPNKESGRSVPSVSKVMWWIQGTQHRLPTTRYSERFGRKGRMSFEEGISRGGHWLRFAGFGSDPFDRSELPQAF